jgi:hypothetical protein
MASSGSRIRASKLTGCQLAEEGGTCGSDKLTVALLSSTNRAIMQTDLNAHHGLIDPFCASGIWSVPQPRWRNSHPATRSPTPHSANWPPMTSGTGGSTH